MKSSKIYLLLVVAVTVVTTFSCSKTEISEGGTTKEHVISYKVTTTNGARINTIKMVISNLDKSKNIERNEIEKNYSKWESGNITVPVGNTGTLLKVGGPTGNYGHFISEITMDGKVIGKSTSVKPSKKGEGLTNLLTKFLSEN